MKRTNKFILGMTTIIVLTACNKGGDPSNISNVGSESVTISGEQGSSHINSSISMSPSVSTSTSTGISPSNNSSITYGEYASTCDLHDYYADAKCATGTDLKSKLLAIQYKTHVDKISYDNSDLYIADASEDPNNPNNTILFYSGKSMLKTRFNPSATQPDAWNKEHMWAKSHGDFASQLAGRDLHHLMPTYSGTNNVRSSNFYDNLKNNGGTAVTTYQSYGQTVKVEYSDPNDMSYKTSTAFEPRDAVKGDTARIILYMALRYSVAGHGTSSALSMVNSGTVNGPYMGKLSVLLQWHIQDPVDDFEKNRNEKIFGFQHNRNPFIDYPQFVSAISW